MVKAGQCYMMFNTFAIILKALYAACSNISHSGSEEISTREYAAP